MQYRREIDGLRAVAVIPVIFFHGGLFGATGGYIGVDVFFVISGYLITTILVEEIDSGKFSILGFYERRARRILPALCFMLFFTTGSGLFSNASGLVEILCSGIGFGCSICLKYIFLSYKWIFFYGS